MAITFNVKYPTALKNAAWQTKKSFKDKTKSKTKTGLGDALKLAEKDWGSIKFDKLIAAKQNLAGKNVTEMQAAKKLAKDYLEGAVVLKAISSLEAASRKARITAQNTALSAKAITAATALTGPLMAQAKLLHDIKLADFDPPVQVRLDIGRLENQHTEALHSMDSIRDDLRDSKTRETWEHSQLHTVLEQTVALTGRLAEESGDKHWADTHEKWRKLFVAYAEADRKVKSFPPDRAAEVIEDFSDLTQKTLGGMFM